MKEILDSLSKLRKGDIPTIFTYNQPVTTVQVEYYYDAMATLIITSGLPFRPRNALSKIGSTCPMDHGLHPEQYDMVSAAILQKMLNTIPAESTTLQDIIHAHAADQDGYGAMYSIMRHYCPYLQDLLAMWGPEWKISDTGYTYGATLRSYLDAEKRANRSFTRREIAAEILQQAMRHDKYHYTASFYLQHLATTQDDDQLGEVYNQGRLIMKLEQNSIKFQHKKDQSAPSTDLKISKTQAPRRFQYRRQVQCRLCKTFGHDIDEDICRFGAQLFFAQRFQEQHGPDSEKNANAYSLANNKTTIKYVCQDVPQDMDMDKAEQLALEWISTDHQE